MGMDYGKIKVKISTPLVENEIQPVFSVVVKFSIAANKSRLLGYRLRDGDPVGRIPVVREKREPSERLQMLVAGVLDAEIQLVDDKINNVFGGFPLLDIYFTTLL
jgi:hypothetical protein